MHNTEQSGIERRLHKQIAAGVMEDCARLLSGLISIALCVLFAFPAPLRESGVSKIVEWMSVHGNQRHLFFLECLLMVVCCAAFALGAAYVDHRCWIGYCALMGFAMVAIVQAKTPLGLFMGALTAVVPLAISAAPRLRNALVFVIAAVLLANCVVASASWILHYQQFHTPGFGDRACGLWKSPCTFYPIAMISCLFCVHQALSAERAAVKALYCVFALTSVVLLMLTFTRSAWIGLLFAAICGSCLKVMAIRRRYLLCLIGVTLVSFSARAHDHIQGLADDRSVTGRFVIWKEAARLIRHAPWFGYGSGGFRSFEHCETALHSTYMPNQAVNLYLNMGVDYGCVGLALFVLFCGSSLWYLAARAKKQTGGRGAPAIPRIAFGSLLAILFAGMTDTTIFGEPIRLPATVLLLTLIGLCYQQNHDKGFQNARKDAVPTLP